MLPSIKRVSASLLGTKQGTTQVIDSLISQKCIIISDLPPSFTQISADMHAAVLSYPQSKLNECKQGEYHNGMVKTFCYWQYSANHRYRHQKELLNKNPDFILSSYPEHPNYLKTYFNYSDFQTFYALQVLQAIDSHLMPTLPGYHSLYEAVKDSNFGPSASICY